MTLGKTWRAASRLCVAWKLRFCFGMYYHMQPYYNHQSLHGYEARNPDRCPIENSYTSDAPRAWSSSESRQLRLSVRMVVRFAALWEGIMMMGSVDQCRVLNASCLAPGLILNEASVVT